MCMLNLTGEMAWELAEAWLSPLCIDSDEGKERRGVTMTTADAPVRGRIGGMHTRYHDAPLKGASQLCGLETLVAGHRRELSIVKAA